jgi:DNA-binding NarL/FixJ family response regulator
MDVMIADDEPAARRTVRECCEREPDLRVIGEFGDPRAALEAIRSQRPHVLQHSPNQWDSSARHAASASLPQSPRRPSSHS